MTDDVKLLPCPFCGDEPKIGSLGGDKQNWLIWCDKCGMAGSETGLAGDSKNEIIVAWNTRATPPDTVTLKREVVEDIERDLTLIRAYSRDLTLNGQSLNHKTYHTALEAVLIAAKSALSRLTSEMEGGV